MKSPSVGRSLVAPLVSSLLTCTLFSVAETQGIQQSQYSAANVVRSGGGLGLTPYKLRGLPGSTMGLPGGKDSLYVSDGMLRGILPLISNLQFDNFIICNRAFEDK